MSHSWVNLLRYPWRIRPWRAVVAMILLVLTVRLAWGWWTGRQLQAALDTIRVRGEPVEVADVVFVPLRDAENAWLVQEQAAAAIVVDSPSNSNLEYSDYLPYPPEWLALAEASEKAHGQAFALARQARRLPRAQVGGPLRSPMPFVLATPLASANALADTINDSAIYAHLQGDDAEAVERIADLLHLAHSLQQGDWMLDQLVAIGISMSACKAVQIIGPSLRLDSVAATRPATPPQVRGLIDRLLDEEPMRAGFHRGMMTERLYMIDLVRQQAKGSWFIRPLAHRQICRDMADYDLVVRASRCNSWAEARSVLHQLPDLHAETAVRPALLFGAGDRTIPRYSRWNYWFHLHHGKDRYVQHYFHVLAARRTAAVSLACHLYRTNQGRWPERLNELVPEYLPAIPSDPFHVDGRPIGYLLLKGQLPGGGDRPLLYFDAGATDVPIPAEPCYGWTIDPRPGREPGRIRQYRDLARFVPASSAEAVDGDPEKPDAPGDQPQQDDQAE